MKKLFLLILLSPLAFAQDAVERKNRPNIVLILMDNFGYGELGVYGGGAIRGAPTPNIDSIAHEGLQLTNYNVDAMCTPSRASLMTGRQSIRTRLQKDAPPRDPWYGLTLWEHTLAELLSDVGYSTGLFGKWHLGQMVKDRLSMTLCTDNRLISRTTVSAELGWSRGGRLLWSRIGCGGRHHVHPALVRGRRARRRGD